MLAEKFGVEAEIAELILGSVLRCCWLHHELGDKQSCPTPTARLLIGQLAYGGDGGPEMAYRFERFEK